MTGDQRIADNARNSIKEFDENKIDTVENATKKKCNSWNGERHICMSGDCELGASGWKCQICGKIHPFYPTEEELTSAPGREIVERYRKM
jgi:ribosomal protein L31